MPRLLFPAFLDLARQRVLVVAAGRSALATIVRLLDADADIVVVAPNAIREIEPCRSGFDAPSVPMMSMAFGM
jgi:siroheme synthase (precorrin-2 oxidase/ferrochelatase)